MPILYRKHISVLLFPGCFCPPVLVSKDDYTTLCLKKNDTDVAHYNFNARQSVLVIFGRDVAEKVCYQSVICYSTFPN